MVGWESAATMMPPPRCAVLPTSVQWLMSGDVLMIGTERAEWILDGNPISTSNLGHQLRIGLDMEMQCCRPATANTP